MEEKQTIALLEDLGNKIEKLEAKLGGKNPINWISKNDLAKMLDCNLSTIHNWSVQGKLKPHYMGGRVYFDRFEIDAVVKSD